MTKTGRTVAIVVGALLSLSAVLFLSALYFTRGGATTSTGGDAVAWTLVPLLAGLVAVIVLLVRSRSRPS